MTVDSDGVRLQLILGDDETGQTVKQFLAEEVSWPLTSDHGTLNRVELRQEYCSDAAHLSTPFILGSCHLQTVTASDDEVVVMAQSLGALPQLLLDWLRMRNVVVSEM